MKVYKKCDEWTKTNIKNFARKDIKICECFVLVLRHKEKRKRKNNNWYEWYLNKNIER